MGPRGHCHSRGSQPSGKLDLYHLYGETHSWSLPTALPPFPAVMNLRGATAGDFPMKRPMPNIYKGLFWASFREAHKSKGVMNQAVDSGNPRLNELLSSCPPSPSTTLPAWSPVRFLPMEEASSPSGEIKSHGNKTKLYIFGCFALFFFSKKTTKLNNF